MLWRHLSGPILEPPGRIDEERSELLASEIHERARGHGEILHVVTREPGMLRTTPEPVVTCHEYLLFHCLLILFSASAVAAGLVGTRRNYFPPG